MTQTKLTSIELAVKYHTPPELNYAYQKAISYSQYSIWASCNYRWYNKYVLNLDPYNDTIHTIFGKAIHETIQHYLTIMYQESGAYADNNINLEEFFEDKLKTIYQEIYAKSKIHITSADEMREFYDDGLEILKWFKNKRSKYFSKSGYLLLGVELPLLVKISGNIYLKGFIDIVLYDIAANKVIIYDIKTSTRGWDEKTKKDDIKIAQVLLYKEYFAKQYNFDVEQIEVEYLIMKRKVWENSDFTIPRISPFKPASGKNKRNIAKENLENFIKDCFDENGKSLEKVYIKNIGEKSCKYCPFDKTEHCIK